MRIETLGDGTPEIAIVGAIHGDEPCGVHAVEPLLDEHPPVERPVKLVIANERALDRDERYVDTDLNRAFPGDRAAEAHETRLAVELIEALDGCQTLVLHATHSTPRPFGIVTEVGPLAATICPYLSIEALIEAKACVDTALGAYVDAIEVECGLQGTEQARATAARLVHEFLQATGALPPSSELSERALPVFRMQERIPKPPADAYTVCVPNFQRVNVNETYATADGSPQVADEPFYPVLLSADGYETQFGYAADLTDHLAPARDTTANEHASASGGMPPARR